MGETFWEHFLGVRTFVESMEIPGRRRNLHNLIDEYTEGKIKE